MALGMRENYKVIIHIAINNIFGTKIVTETGRRGSKLLLPVAYPSRKGQQLQTAR